MGRLRSIDFRSPFFWYLRKKVNSDPFFCPDIDFRLPPFSVPIDFSVNEWLYKQNEQFPKRTHGAMITSTLRRNDIATSFWRNDDVIIVSCSIWMAQVIGIVLRLRKGPTCLARPIPWQLMPWRDKEPGHHRSWYWSNLPGIFRISASEGLKNQVRKFKSKIESENRVRISKQKINGTFHWEYIHPHSNPYFKQNLKSRFPFSLKPEAISIRYNIG